MNWMGLIADEAPNTNAFPWGIVVAVVVIIVCLVFMALIAQFIGLYIRALFSGAKVNLTELIGMKLRKVNALTIVNGRIQATRAGLMVSQPEMESHVLAGGDVLRVIAAMIAAHKAGIDLSWQVATAIDLAGRDILEAVQTSVNPKVIDVPNQTMGQTTIDGVSKDGIQLRVKARVTIRTNIKSLVGGATEETVVARVGEGIVNAIGASEDYKHVLQNPDKISKTVLEKGLAANTAFEIISIDIAEISPGENIGAKLAADRAESDKRRFQAEAEQRRAMAVAQEQENVAKQAENRALVVLAEAEIPRAMADALRSGNFGVMDFYRLKNIQSDTAMREAIAKPTDMSKPVQAAREMPAMDELIELIVRGILALLVGPEKEEIAGGATATGDAFAWWKFDGAAAGVERLAKSALAGADGGAGTANRTARPPDHDPAAAAAGAAAA